MVQNNGLWENVVHYLVKCYLVLSGFNCYLAVPCHQWPFPLRCKALRAGNVLLCWSPTPHRMFLTNCTGFSSNGRSDLHIKMISYPYTELPQEWPSLYTVTRPFLLWRERKQNGPWAISPTALGPSPSTDNLSRSCKCVWSIKSGLPSQSAHFMRSDFQAVPFPRTFSLPEHKDKLSAGLLKLEYEVISREKWVIQWKNKSIQQQIKPSPQ